MSVYLDGGDVVLYHGDALAVLPLLPPVDVVIADPPYGATSLGWDRQVAGWLERVTLAPGGSVWVFGSLRSFMRLADELSGWKIAQDIVWKKHNGSSFHADRFKRVHELAVHLYRGQWADVYKAPVTTPTVTAHVVRHKQAPPHTGHTKASSYASQDGGPRLQQSVIDVRSCHGYAEHPTQKPVGILTPLIEFSCPLGGLVLDPFAGSGSTLVAARMLGRRSVGIEIDPGYVAIAAQRLGQQSLLTAEGVE